MPKTASPKSSSHRSRVPANLPNLETLANLPATSIVPELTFDNKVAMLALPMLCLALGFYRREPRGAEDQTHGNRKFPQQRALMPRIQTARSLSHPIQCKWVAVVGLSAAKETTERTSTSSPKFFAATRPVVSFVLYASHDCSSRSHFEKDLLSHRSAQLNTDNSSVSNSAD